MADNVEAAAAALLEQYRKGEIGTAELMVRVWRTVFGQAHALIFSFPTVALHVSVNLM